MIKLVDEALLQVYKPVNLLGAGGTGQSWLMVDKETNEYLAVKLIPRPIPSVLQPMMLREIEVRPRLPPVSTLPPSPFVVACCAISQRLCCLLSEGF
jgi:serine/threonine protein kinase